MNFASEEAQVTFDDSKTSAADIAKIIEKTGYGAKEKTEDTLPQPEAEHHIGWRLWLLLAINIPFFNWHGRHDDRAARLDDSAVVAVCAGKCGTALAGGAVYKARGQALGRVGEHGRVGYHRHGIDLPVFRLYAVFSPHAAHGGTRIWIGVMVIGFVSLGKFWNTAPKNPA